METKAQAWDTIAARYRNSALQGWGNEMPILVEHIISSGLSNRLFAFTSLNILKISIYEMMSNHRETLHISFDVEKQLFQFKYYAVENSIHQPEFQRLYSRDVGIEKFDQFIRWIRW